MRDDEIRQILVASNPWWAAAARGGDRSAWMPYHRLLRGRADFDLGYRPTVLSDIATEPLDDSLVVLTGPRRVGKSVALIDAIATLCSRPEIDPRQIIHISCEGMRERDLRRTLTLARALTASADSAGELRRIWFFDEVTAVPGWTGVLKQARDLSSFGADTVVATGSRWAGNSQIHGDLMAGRAGSGGRRRIRQLMPMSFRDYLAAVKPGLERPERVHPSELASSAVHRELAAAIYSVDDYDLAWQDYLTCGGFPRAVAEHSATGAVSGAFAEDLMGWLRTDIDEDASRESIPLLLVELADRMTSPLNMTNLAEELNYGSRNSLERRLARMVRSYAALRCHQRADSGRIVNGSQHKVYLTDPILAWLPSMVSAGLPAPDFTKLTEAALGVSLARRIDSLDQGRWSDDDTIGFARTASGGEIDLAPARVPAGVDMAWSVPIESKWVGAGWKGESRPLAGKYGRGLVATKSVLDTTNSVWAVPAPLVALLLE
ncbi:MAG: AAA family ATPase [Bifidobacteriaceae bacterium]|jgi:predicted AAA+ superfamily ATPase|nr:AAA family ATPase [Bifidobacteriaceae bacterium]